MKKTILTVILLFIMALLLSSCSSGISKDSYDKVNSDLTAAQTQIQSLQNDEATAQTQIQTLQTQVSSLQSNLQNANAKISTAKTVTDILNLAIQASENSSSMTQAQLAEDYVQWANDVKAIGDPTLSSKFDALTNTSTQDQRTQASQDFMSYLIEFQSQLLQ